MTKERLETRVDKRVKPFWVVGSTEADRPLPVDVKCRFCIPVEMCVDRVWYVRSDREGELILYPQKHFLDTASGVSGLGVHDERRIDFSSTSHSVVLGRRNRYPLANVLLIPMEYRGVLGFPRKPDKKRGNLGYVDLRTNFISIIVTRADKPANG